MSYLVLNCDISAKHIVSCPFFREGQTLKGIWSSNKVYVKNIKLEKEKKVTMLRIFVFCF